MESTQVRPTTAPAHGRRVRFKEPLIEESTASPKDPSPHAPKSGSSTATTRPQSSQVPGPRSLNPQALNPPSQRKGSSSLTEHPTHLGYRPPPAVEQSRPSTSAGLGARQGQPGIFPVAPSARDSHISPPIKTVPYASSVPHAAPSAGTPAPEGMLLRAPRPVLPPSVQASSPRPKTTPQQSPSTGHNLRQPVTHLPTAPPPAASGSAKVHPVTSPMHATSAPSQTFSPVSKHPKQAPAPSGKLPATELRQLAAAAAAAATGGWSKAHPKPTPGHLVHPAPPGTQAPGQVPGPVLNPKRVQAAGAEDAASAALRQMQNKVRRMEWELGRLKADGTKASVVSKWGRLAFGAARLKREQVQARLEGAEKQLQTLEERERERELKASMEYLELEGQDHRELLLGLENQLATAEQEIQAWQARERDLQVELDIVRKELISAKKGEGGKGGMQDRVSGLEAREKSLEESLREASNGARASQVAQAVWSDMRDELATKLRDAEEENRALRERNLRLEVLVQQLDLGTGSQSGQPNESRTGGQTVQLQRTATWDVDDCRPGAVEQRMSDAGARSESEGDLLKQINKMRALLLESEQKRFSLFMGQRVGIAVRSDLEERLKEAEKKADKLEAHVNPNKGLLDAQQRAEELERELQSERELSTGLKAQLNDARRQNRSLLKQMENLEGLVHDLTEKLKYVGSDVDTMSSRGDIDELYELANIA